MRAAETLPLWLPSAVGDDGWGVTVSEDPQQIKLQPSRADMLTRLNALCAAAEDRIPESLPAGVSCAAVMWMTDAEVAEAHELKQALGSDAYYSSAAAAERVRQRTAEQRAAFKEKTHD